MEQVKAFIKRNYLFIIFVLGVFVLHLSMNATADDIQRIDTFRDMSLKDVWAYTLNKCNTVSHRYITYFIVNTMLYIRHGFFLWRVLDTIVIFMLLKTISYLFISNKNVDKLLLLLVAMYPIKDMVTAGPLSTTVGYLWPLAFGMLAFAILKKQSTDRLHFLEVPLFLFGVLYGADQEQMCIAQILIYAYILIKSIWQKKINILAIVGMVISVAYCLLHVSLGHSVRTEFEVSAFFPDFYTLSFVDKVEMAFSSTMDRLIYDYGIFFVLSLVLLIGVWMRTEDNVLRMCSLLPVVCVLVGNTNLRWLQTLRYTINTDIGHDVKYGVVNVDNYIDIISYLPLFVFCVVALLTLVNIYISDDNKLQAYELIGIIVTGMISRMALCITPNIYASNDRTYLFLFFALIAVIVCLVDTNMDKVSKLSQNKTIKSAVMCALPILTVCFFVNNALELLAMI